MNKQDAHGKLIRIAASLLRVMPLAREIEYRPKSPKWLIREVDVHENYLRELAHQIREAADVLYKGGE